MAIIKVQSEGINLADTFNFTGTFSPNNKPAFHVWNSSATSIADNAWTKINTQSAVFDTDSWHDTTNNRITVPSGTASGYMLFSWSVRVNYDGIGDNTSAALRKNGSGISQQLKFYSGQEAEAMAYSNSIVYSYAAGDYFELYAFQDSASNVAKNTNPGVQDTYLTGMKLIGV